MKKKLTFIAIFAAVLALSSCVWVDLGDDDVKPSEPKIGSICFTMRDKYRSDYNIEDVCIKENGSWVSQKDLDDYSYKYTVTVTAKVYSEIRITIYKNGSFFENRIYKSVRVYGDKATSFTVQPTQQGTLNVRISDTYKHAYYIQKISIKENGTYKDIWNYYEHGNYLTEGAYIDLDPGKYYDFKVSIYKLSGNTWFEDQTISSVEIEEDKTVTKTLTPNIPGTLNVTLLNTYSNLLFIGEVKVDGIEKWNSDDHYADWMYGADINLNPGTYSVEIKVYKQTNGSRASLYQTFNRTVTIYAGQTNSLVLTADKPEGTLKVTINSDIYGYFIGEIYTKTTSSSSWSKVWDSNDYRSTYLSKAEVKLNEGYYDIRFVTYDPDNYHYTDYTREDIYITAKETTYFSFGRNGLLPQ